MAFRPRRQGSLLASFLTVGLFSQSSAWAAQPAVAGLAPHQRPAGAPVLTRPPADTAKGLHGIATPLPPGLDFMASQGAWYTPFTRPGMPAPYDLRGWHTEAAKR